MSENGENIDISEITEEKDLGILFSNDLKFSKHVVSCSNKANKIIGIIRGTFSYMEKNMFLQPYKTLIRPRLEYGYNMVTLPEKKTFIYWKIFSVEQQN
ncbi:MAG: hypothetical protein AB2693_19445 [Candidatus Thiodiazotropha sp.]